MRRSEILVTVFAVAVIILSAAPRGSGRASAGMKGHGAEPQSAYPIPGDRWMEIDLYWFAQNDIAGSVKAFWDRFQPLYSGVQGYHGVILNVGWTVSCVMEWSGDLHQRITLPHGSGQQHWVEERGPLRGTTEERKAQAQVRFARQKSFPHRGYDPWTYGDLEKLANALREEAAKRGIAGFKVGMLNYAWTNAYGEVPAWVHRHPEAFTAWPSLPSGGSPFSLDFDPGARLHADSTRLGGFPNGISEGMPVHRAYAAQWGSLSKNVGLDAIMLRDSFGFPVPYQRQGPWGPVVPSPEVSRQATATVAALVREIKTANREALVMMYSNGASAVADWRANGLDLEAVAKEGYLDIFVDQTWAGAWNEVGLRETDFWNNPLLGWTYQLAYTLLHAATLADTKVRHYPLVETFDAWEDWDVIHTAPERLRWGIWAYSHAAVKTPRGLKLPAGSYISWANQGKRLLDSGDVRFLTDNLNSAIADARQTREVFGPTLVYSRESMQWQADHATTQHDIKEWVDEQAGSVMKWPVPILSVTRVEWLPQVKSDLFVLQTPSHLAPQHVAEIAELISHGHPIAIFGSPAGGVDSTLAQLGGLGATGGPSENQATIHLAKVTGGSSSLVQDAPESFKTYYRLTRNQASPGVRVLSSIDGNPVLTLNTAGGKRIVMWDPTDIVQKYSVPLAELWGGSGGMYALVAGALNSLLASSEVLHAKRIDLEQTLNYTAWRTADGTIRVMAANLEEGLRNDADLTRHAAIVLPSSWKLAQWTDDWTGRKFKTKEGEMQLDLPQASSVLLEGQLATGTPLKSR